MQAYEFSSYLYDSHRIDIPNNVQIKPNQNIRVMVLIEDVPKIEVKKKRQLGILKGKISIPDDFNETKTEPKKKRQLGILKGQFSISDDFDEPLDDLKEYMY